jgi:L-lactate dehydrogenase complex protein LldE
MIPPIPDRPPVTGKRVSFFVTCIVDMIYPQTGMATVEILERLGIPVDFPEGQTCCGQMGYNGGYREEARAVAIQFLKAFRDAEVIVTPSGSCAGMLRQLYPQLFAQDDEWRDVALRVSSITWELTEYLVDGLGVTDVGATLKHPHKIALHDSCHGLREMGIKKQPRALLSHVKQLELVELPGAEQCCGFGGLFAIKMADISGAMLNEKVNAILSSEADTIVTCDTSCMTQINGGLRRRGSDKRAVHIADVLAGRLD